MKTARNILTVLVLLVLLYGGGYWYFIKKRYSYDLSHGEPLYLNEDEYLNPQGIHAYARKFFAPAEEIDWRINYDRPLRNRLAGHWSSTEADDFVTISKQGDGAFRLGAFEYSGKIDLNRDRPMFSCEFQHEGKTYFFTLSAQSDNMWVKLPDQLAKAEIHWGQDHFGPCVLKASLTNSPEGSAASETD